MGMWTWLLHWGGNYLQVLPDQPDGQHHAEDQVHGQAKGVPPGVLIACDLDDLVGGLEPLLHHRRLRSHKGVLLPLGADTRSALLLFHQQVNDLVGIGRDRVQRPLQLHVLPVVVLPVGQPLLSHLRAHQTAIEQEHLGAVLFPGGKVLGVEFRRTAEVSQLQDVQLGKMKN